MTAQVSAIVLPMLRGIEEKVDRALDDVGELKVRMTSLEQQIALLHGDFANQSGRMGRMEQRLGRIEWRLQLADAPAE